MSKNKKIINPNKITSMENQFLHEVKDKTNNTTKMNQYRGRMVSMSDDFNSLLNDFLKSNPTEGNRSSFIVRVVADYIKNKNS